MDNTEKQEHRPETVLLAGEVKKIREQMLAILIGKPIATQTTALADTIALLLALLPPQARLGALEKITELAIRLVPIHERIQDKAKTIKVN